MAGGMRGMGGANTGAVKAAIKKGGSPLRKKGPAAVRISVPKGGAMMAKGGKGKMC